MSISLADALRQVELCGGRVYRCQVGRFQIEVRVNEIAPQLTPAPLETSDVMLDPWTELLSLQPRSVSRAVPGPPLLPDVVDLPTDAKP